MVLIICFGTGFEHNDNNSLRNCSRDCSAMGPCEPVPCKISSMYELISLNIDVLSQPASIHMTVILRGSRRSA